MTDITKLWLRRMWQAFLFVSGAVGTVQTWLGIPGTLGQMKSGAGLFTKLLALLWALVVHVAVNLGNLFWMWATLLFFVYVVVGFWFLLVHRLDEINWELFRKLAVFTAAMSVVWAITDAIVGTDRVFLIFFGSHWFR